MPDAVAVTFQYALGQRVHLARGPQERGQRWRVLERWYLEGTDYQAWRYLLITRSETATVMAEEAELTPAEDC